MLEEINDFINPYFEERIHFYEEYYGSNFTCKRSNGLHPIMQIPTGKVLCPCGSYLTLNSVRGHRTRAKNILNI